MARILFLAHRIPYPPNKGDKIRSWHFLKHLAQQHDVHLGYYVDDPRDLKHVTFLEKIVESQCSQFIGKSMQKLLSTRGLLTGAPLTVAAYPAGKLRRYVNGLVERSQIDLVFLFSGATFPLISDLPENMPVVADLVDVDSAKWAAYGAQAAFPMSWIYQREARLLAAFEASVAARCRSTVFVSADEAALFRRMVNKDTASKITDVPNGVDTYHFDPARFKAVSPLAKRLIFTGAMDYAPNIEAAEWFVDEVWPGIRRTVPDAEFVIAGGPEHPRVRALAKTGGVTVTGYVEDMAAEIAKAAVVVAPLLTARGIQNKVLEGMAMAGAVVVTPAAKEGIVAEHGKHLVVAEDAASMQHAVENLLVDPGKRRTIGDAARRQICTEYGWPKSYEKLDAHITKALERFE